VAFKEGQFLRCFKCGGAWADSYVLNNLTGRDLVTWRRISISPSWISGGKGMCPADGMKLSGYKGEGIPPTLAVSRCSRCGKWWFPGDSLFIYKPAIETKMTYSRLWGVVGETKSMLLPVLSVAVFLAVTVLGVSLVQKRQLLEAGAGSGVTDVAITYAGEGKAVVVFKADNEVAEIGYKEDLDIGWKTEVTVRKENVYTVQISGLTEGREYYFLIGGREYKFRTR
jgi:hypothetical protein